MYGFVFEAIKAGIQENYSSSVWYTVTETVSNVPLEFEKGSNYDDELISDLAKGKSVKTAQTVGNFTLQTLGG